MAMVRASALLTRPRILSLFLALIAGLWIAGCSNNKVSGPQRVPLTVKALGTGAPGKTAATARAVFLAEAAPTESIPVTYTQALLVVRDVRFLFGEAEHDSIDDEGGGDDSTGADLEDDDDEEDGSIIFRGPFVIDLLAQTAESLGTELVPPGDYERVQGHLRALHPGDWNAAQFASLIGSTVLLSGVVEGDGGGPFTYTARIDDEFMIRGHFNVAASTPAVAFITFDLSKWLIGPDGQFLDPRNPDNAKWIEWAIRHAIKVRMDEDHDGEPEE